MPPVNKPSFHEHIKLLQQPNIWVTQVEVIAVAIMVQVPVYYYKMSDDNFCHWEVTHTLKDTTVRGDLFLKATELHHFELLYWDRVHYDCVVSHRTGKCSSSVPVLLGVESYIDITS